MIRSPFKQAAIELRRKGLTYSEILRKVPVAKSTLGVWLHSVGLSKTQHQRISEKKLASALRGGARKREIRMASTRQIHSDAAKDVTSVSTRELFFIGVALYWAEGSKEKEERPGSGVLFSNSDPKMIKLFLRWLVDVCAIPVTSVVPELYIHKSAANSVPSAIRFWASATGLDESIFTRIYFKQNKVSTNRKNIGKDYFGLVRIRVRRSSVLNRRIVGWINAINQCMI